MEEKIDSKPICGIPVSSYFAGKGNYLHIQKHILCESTPPISEDDSLFIFANKGKGLITINGVEFSFDAGAFAWLQSYHTFTIEPLLGETLELSVCVYDYPLSSFLTFHEPNQDVLYAFTNVPPIIKLEGERLIKIRDLLDEFEAEDQCYDPGSSLIKVSILGQFSTIFINNSIKKQKTEEKIARPLGWRSSLYIGTHFVEELTAEKTAAHFNTDVVTLNRELRKISGRNFIQTLNRVRVNIASASILFEDLSLSYIASRSGFPSEVSFYRSFKKYWGVTPQEYQKLLLNTGDGVYRDMIMGTSLMAMLNYIYTNFAEQINMKAIAEELYISESIVRDLIFEKFGIDCKKLINQSRIRHAEAHLLITNLPLLDIAVGVGFNSCRTFTRAFREINLMTPSEYRSKYRGGLKSERQ